MTTPPPPQPSAGWYPDPTGKPGQMYWDGEAWHRLTPDIPGTPKPTQPPVSTKGPSGQRKVGFVLAGLALLVIAVQVVGRQVWGRPLEVLLVALGIAIIGVTIAVRSGQSGARKVMFVSAMVLVLFASGWVAAGFDYLLFGKGSSPSSSSPDSQQSQSPSQSQSPYYQEGYNSGTSGLARNGYGDDMYNTGATVAEMEHNACSAAINNEPNYASIQDADQPGNQDDYMNGCLNAFRDHPPAAKPKPGPLNPYR